MDQLLSFLPFELRSLIVQEFVRKRCVVLLRLNSQICRELLPEIYGNFSVIVDPAFHQSQVVLFDDPKCVLLTTSVHIQEPAQLKGKRIPFHHFKSVDITILPTDTKIPGQLIRAWYQVTRFLDWLLPQSLFRHTPVEIPSEVIPAVNNMYLRLPRIRVKFSDTDERSWRTKRITWDTESSEGPRLIKTPKSTIWSNKSWTVGRSVAPMSSDLEILLLPFRRIRHAGRVLVELPWSAKEVKLANFGFKEHALASQIERYGRMEIPYGLRRNKMEFDDNDHQREEDAWHLYLEFFLDVCDDPVADQIRLDRFANWCGWYEQHMKHRLEGKIAFGGAQHFNSLNRIRTPMVDWAISERIMALRAFWPVARGSAPQSSDWRAVYPEGIPARGSASHDARVPADRDYDPRFTDSIWGKDRLAFQCPHCK